MNSSSLAPASEEATLNPADVYKRSLALNASISDCHPLIMSYILSFDEILHNMQIFFKLSKLVRQEENDIDTLSYQELFLYCRDNGIMRGTLGEWMIYQSLRRKIRPGMDKTIIQKIVEIAPRFVDEINFMVAGLERELRKYRTIN